MHTSIRSKLLAAFALNLLLVVGLGWFAAQQMARMNERAAFVEQQTIPSQDRVARIATVINAYRVRQLEYLIYGNESDKNRSQKKMGDLEREMDGYFTDYQPLVNTEREDTRFKAVTTVWHDIVDANHQQFIPAVRLANTGSVQPFYSRMNPLYDRLDLAMTQLSEESQGQATSALDEVRSAYESARNFILADTAATIILSAVIGLTFSGRIALRISRLTGATTRVASGELDRKVEIISRDEIGVLAHSFNQMLDSLREQRSALEQRHIELQISLSRQEQLTADLVRGKQAEEEAYQAQIAAEAASQAKSMFLATMSHELRTPLNAILGYAQLMRLRAMGGSTDPEDREQLDRILSAGRHLTTLISNVLDFSKIEQGKIDLNISHVDVFALVHEVTDIVLPLVQRQENTLRIDCLPDIGTLDTDGPKLRQILFNLLSNAAKFTENGTVTLRVTQEAGGRRQDDHLPPPASSLLFDVIDTGIGIADDQLDKLFQPFSQIDSSVTRRFDGTGLGLALSRQLCLALGGDINVESSIGYGSTFRVCLPTYGSTFRVPLPTNDSPHLIKCPCDSRTTPDEKIH
ncbi:MAG: ATP-binding protein [Chloroflexales bacterium]